MDNHRETLEQLLACYREAKIGRREMIRRALVLGLSSSSIATLVHATRPVHTRADDSVRVLDDGRLGAYASMSARQNGEMSVWVVGDSVMWGQGLTRKDKYAFAAAEGIAALRGQTVSIDYDSPDEPVWFSPRSGAKIRADLAISAPDGTGGDRIDIRLPSGRTITAIEGDRTSFYLRFPDYFPVDADAEACWTDCGAVRIGRSGCFLRPFLQRPRLVEAEDAAASGLRLQQVRELGLLAGAFVEYGQWQAPGRHVTWQDLGVSLRLNLHALEGRADRLGFELAVHIDTGKRFRVWHGDRFSS